MKEVHTLTPYFCNIHFNLTLPLTEDGQNNGNTTQYRNKTVCVGCTERTLVVSFDILLFVYAV
jgi:hypothetical protein